ncbi:sensor histidine kinase [Halocella sp. SP3-1]|nr:sensor histidine kinase [Halocella sp. SP3-1]
MVLTFIIIYLLMNFDYSPITGALTSSMYTALLVIIVGVIISTYVSKKMLRPILKINDAAKKVAMGDFSVRLEGKSIAKEIKQIEENFNIMVKELSNIETLRNDFVSNVSHEFKTPLSVIEGYATLLQDDTLSREEEDKYIQYILENTERLTKLTHNILSLSRLENQGIVLQKEWFSLDEQIRRVLLCYESIWEEKNLSIELNMENIMYYGNKPLLAQVWSNIIDNAIKFSIQNGILSIDCRLKGKNIIISVKDNGVGMEEEVKKLSFDKFYQGELSHNVKGNGLGLPLVKRIVTLCGGTVSLESEKGIGTTVIVTFDADL